MPVHHRALLGLREDMCVVEVERRVIEEDRLECPFFADSKNPDSMVQAVAPETVPVDDDGLLGSHGPSLRVVESPLNEDPDAIDQEVRHETFSAWDPDILLVLDAQGIQQLAYELVSARLPDLPP